VTSMQARDQRRGHREPGSVLAAPPAARRRRRIALAPAPESTSAARDFTVATLRGWCLDALVQDAVMVVSELVTNAIRHGRASADAGDGVGSAVDAGRAAGPGSAVSASDAGSAGQPRVELSLCCQGGRLICTVTDESSMPPVLTLADFDAETGRGLQVVQALAISWGWRPLNIRGKAVWAAFKIDSIS
jgi:anti-sigma regulatory factor (Ser/Thr protein kinase)